MENVKAIKLSEALANWQKGAAVLLVEYRHSIAETIQWRDRASGKAMSAGILRHTCETEREAIIVNERQGDTFRPDDYVSPFKKGQRVLLHITNYTTERGVVKVDGHLQPVEEKA